MQYQTRECSFNINFTSYELYRLFSFYLLNVAVDCRCPVAVLIFYSSTNDGVD